MLFGEEKIEERSESDRKQSTESQNKETGVSITILIAEILRNSFLSKLSAYGLKTSSKRCEIVLEKNDQWRHPLTPALQHKIILLSRGFIYVN